MLKSLYARTIWLMFLSFSFIVLAAGYFRFWAPNQETIQNRVTVYNAYVTETNKVTAAVKKKENAAKAIQVAQAGWLPYVETKTPLEGVAQGGINLNVNQYQLLLDTKKFRDSVQTALNTQLKKGGVKVISGPRIPGVTDQDAPNGVLASYFNYPSAPFPVVIYDLGQVTVQGTYEEILLNVRSWAGMPRYLAVAHNLALSGTAPRLTGTYDLSLVGYIRYDGIYGPVPDGGGASAPAAGGGSPFGGPSGGAPAAPAFAASGASSGAAGGDK
ncbi:MAG: hypothetical protein QE269_11915 [Fimbriimonas sp.]|nr:hypothetical protein [Fimbriimonas sp.]